LTIHFNDPFVPHSSLKMDQLIRIIVIILTMAPEDPNHNSSYK